MQITEAVLEATSVASPGSDPGLKVPTPPVGGVQGAKGAPPVVEEWRGRIKVNHRGGTSCRVAREL